MSFIEIEYREKSRPQDMAALQSHDYYEIYCLLEGQRTIFFEGRMINLPKGSVSVIPPFCMHKTEGGAYKRINIYISADLLDQSEKQLLSELGAEASVTLLGERGELFWSLLLASGKDKGRERVALPIVKTLLFLLRGAERRAVEAISLSQTKNDGNSSIMQIIDYINSHLDQNISLEHISTRFFVSKNTLCKRFRSVMNCSLLEYTSGARLSAAKNLLLTTSMSMEEIAERCGYSSANYFGVAFKKQVGLSPMNYRKKK